MDLPAERPASNSEGRLASLDALRGWDMFRTVGGRAVVSGPARGPDSEWLDRHVLLRMQPASWEGFTAWDLILPPLCRERVFIRI